MNRADWNHEIAIQERLKGVSTMDWNHVIHLRLS